MKAFNISQLKTYRDFSASDLERLIDDTDEETAFKMLEHYAENLQALHTQLPKFIAEKNITDAWKVCHKIVGTGALLGYKELANKSRELENKLKVSNSSAGLEREIAELCSHTEMASRSIQSILKSA